MNQAYNQFNAIPPRHQEDGGRGAGVMSGLMLGGAIGATGTYLANYSYNTQKEYVNENVNKLRQERNAGRKLILKENSLLGNTREERVKAARQYGNKYNEAIKNIKESGKNTMTSKYMNSGFGKFVAGSGRARAITTIGTALAGGILGGALDDPNS